MPLTSSTVSCSIYLCIVKTPLGPIIPSTSQLLTQTLLLTFCYVHLSKACLREAAHDRSSAYRSHNMVSRPIVSRPIPKTDCVLPISKSHRAVKASVPVQSFCLAHVQEAVLRLMPAGQIWPTQLQQLTNPAAAKQILALQPSSLPGAQPTRCSKPFTCLLSHTLLQLWQYRNENWDSAYICCNVIMLLVNSSCCRGWHGCAA